MTIGFAMWVGALIGAMSVLAPLVLFLVADKLKRREP